MSPTITDTERETALEELRLSLQSALAAHRRLRSRDSRLAGQIGFVHYRLMAELRREGRMTASALAAAAELSPATVSEMLDGLVAADLVERTRDEADRRVVHVSLTARGRRAINAKQARFRAAWSRELDDLDPAALEAATVVLGRLAGFFDRL
jgi:DNA-binding MarR family transcriptional regulator